VTKDDSFEGLVETEIVQVGVELVEMSPQRATLSTQWVQQDELPGNIPKGRQVFIITNSPTQISVELKLHFRGLQICLSSFVVHILFN
jgi:hypothetical protein